MIRKHIRHYVTKFHEVLDAKDAPHSVAGGTAIGVFFGFLPIFGFKTLAAIGASMLTRCSVIASVIGVTLHDILFPIWPLVWRLQYQIGFWILSHPHHFAPPIKKVVVHFSEFFEWDNFMDMWSDFFEWSTVVKTCVKFYEWFMHLGIPLMVGGLVLAIPSSIITYAVILVVVRIRRSRKISAES
jgi:uncharacterized protein (DUF2062 family)